MLKYILHTILISSIFTPYLFCADNQKQNGNNTHNKKCLYIIEIDPFNGLKNISSQLEYNMDQFEKELYLNGEKFNYPPHLVQYWHRNVKAVKKLKKASQ